MKERWWKTGHHDNQAAAKFELLLRTFQVEHSGPASLKCVQILRDISRIFNLYAIPCRYLVVQVNSFNPTESMRKDELRCCLEPKNSE